MRPEDFKLVNEALLERGFLAIGAANPITEFNVASQSAYADYLNSVPGLHHVGNHAVPETLDTIPGDLLADVPVEQIEESEAIEEEEEESEATEEEESEEEESEEEEEEEEEESEEDEE